MESTNFDLKHRQIAILGSSGDLATEEELTLARMCGKYIALRGYILIVGGDDGVMGAAAHGAKEEGGTTIAVIARQKYISRSWLFDAIIDTDLSWVQFSDCLIKSCCGAIIIGGGAGTLAELSLLYLNGIPAAFLGATSTIALNLFGKHLDARKLGSYPLASTPEEAVESIVSSINQREPGLFETYRHRGTELHFKSYPFGIAGDYLEAAHYLRLATVMHNSEQEIPLGELTAQWHDAAGDQRYYLSEEYFAAAHHYSQALAHLNEGAKDSSRQGPGSQTYLRAMIMESLAFGLANIGEYRVAQSMLKEAILTYQTASVTSEATESKQLMHSSLALMGETAYLQAVIEHQNGLYSDALHSISEARKFYNQALDLCQLWNSGFRGDNYASHIAKLEKLIEEIRVQMCSTLYSL